MKRAGLATCVACASILAAAFTASAVAADTNIYTFYDCDGPAGTPLSFTAVKTRLPAAAPHRPGSRSSDQSALVELPRVPVK